MDLVTITDHDQISGALALGDRDDVLIGCEVTAEWPDIDLCVHINVFDITLAQHDEIQRLREDVRQLMPYLHQQGIDASLNHVASGINGPLTAAHLTAVLPWVNWSRSDQRHAAAVAESHRDVPGGVRTMMSDMWRFTGNFFAESLAATAASPSDWRGYACTFGGVLSLPVVPVLMAAPFVHFLHEQRFNRDLLYDLIARPDSAARLVPGLAA